MSPIHTILHATDFSEHSAYAFRLACALARDYGARLVVMHAVATQAIPYGEGILLPAQEELGTARQRLEQLQVPHADVRAERRLEQGDAVAEILRVAAETGADLIVLGTHGRTGLGRLLMGSIAEQVVRKADCPVLTVRTPFLETAPRARRVAEPALV